jgi:hypothetical protein
MPDRDRTDDLLTISTFVSRHTQTPPDSISIDSEKIGLFEVAQRLGEGCVCV